eukprot:4153435-Pyramimonas_sp.AAC.1
MPFFTDVVFESKRLPSQSSWSQRSWSVEFVGHLLAVRRHTIDAPGRTCSMPLVAVADSDVSREEELPPCLWVDVQIASRPQRAADEGGAYAFR